MSEEIDNIIIEHLKALRNELREFRQESRTEFETLKLRINAVERGIAGMHDDNATLHTRIDTVDSHINKIEKRLELAS
jgi:predicted  nucleic acid-binding Zn-ribbon protein